MRHIPRTNYDLVSDIAEAGKDSRPGSCMIMGGYRFLMQHYIKGDKICMFGFSRGAYTARCLAGMLHKIGLLPISNEEHIPFAYKRYVDISKDNEKHAKSFKETFSMHVEIAFMGVWDTVASCGLFGRHLPFTASNNIIRIFRHALALDERRSKFKPNQWHRTAHSIKGARNDPNGATRIVPPLTNGPHRKETLNDYIQSVRDEYRRRREKETVWSDDREAYDLGTKKEDYVGGGSVKNGTPHCLANASLVWMVNNVLQADVGISFKRDAFQSPADEAAGLVPHYGGRPGVNPFERDGEVLKSKDAGPIVKLDTVNEDNEKSEPSDEDGVETTGVAYSADKPVVTVPTPPPKTPENDQATSSTPSVLDRKRQSLRWLRRRQRMDLQIPQRPAASQGLSAPVVPSSPISPVIAQSAQILPTIIEPPSRNSEKTMIGNDNDLGGLCWVSQTDINADANSEMVDQLDELKAWWILEYLPLWQHYQDRYGDWHKGFHFNRGKPRRILDPEPQFHSSVKLRTCDNYVASARVKGGVVQYVDF
ncbi:hypothetical protein FRC05_004929 [Tulasnella sp. 425]|nr:hypothetical protein FRC05_004929 [Tulasnella sp. 425]